VVVAIVLVEGGGCVGQDGGLASAGVIEQAVIGGDSTQPGEYPATGALIRGLTYRCTATLIAPDVAITAAHCLVDEGWGDFGFTLDADLTDRVDDIIPVLVHHQHPSFRDAGDFTSIGQRNDIGVIVLEQPIEGVAVELIDPSDELAELRAETELRLCGYGREDWSAQGSAGVKRDALVFVDELSDWEIQSTDEDPQPCRGDSGGPLFVETPERRWLAGLVSRAVGDTRMCASGAIYTRVAPYMEWIDQASADRDTGCAVGAGGGAVWPAVLGWLLAVRRRRPIKGAGESVRR